MTALPTGTVTLLLADVEGSTRLWETRPEHMRSAIALLDEVLRELTEVHSGVRPVEQGEGDSFVLAFARASDAVACALSLQRAPLAPLRLRIGVHTGEIELRDEGNYFGPTINRTARLRDLAHGGQTVMSAATEAMVVDHLPADAWLTDLGIHPLRDLPRPERVVQLCHPDVCNEFPPLRVTAATAQRLPRPLTSFVGRAREKQELCDLVTSNRLVTLTGAGGVGKTRIALEVAHEVKRQFPDGVWWVDLASLTDQRVVPLAVARTVGLPDQPGRSTVDTLVTFGGDRRILLVFDNCEHLLDACGELIAALIDRCPALTILATSREPVGVAGEFVWRVPSLPLDSEAVELFVDRARRTRPDFRLVEDSARVVTEVCRRLDGMPLAIELAAARVRTLTLTQIRDSLHDRFRLLTGGSRTAVRRQQTLRASVEWSHALLTEPERVLFRRLAAFMNGFDLDAAQAVGADDDAERVHILDLLSLLVDKSLVVAEDADRVMRYRFLETVRQFALEKLSESGEADAVRTRHRDHYATIAVGLAAADSPGREQLIEWAENEIDNLRAAYSWSRETNDFENGLLLATSLQDVWFRRGRQQEGMVALDLLLEDSRCRSAVPAELWVRGVADQAILAAAVAVPVNPERAQEALACARHIDDPVLLAQTLMSCGMLAFYDLAVAHEYFSEAVAVADTSGNRWLICQIRTMEAIAKIFAGDPAAAAHAAQAGLAVSEEVGDRYFALHCRIWLGVATWHLGWLKEAEGMFRALADEAAETDVEPITTLFRLVGHAGVAIHQGDIDSATGIVEKAVAVAQDAGGFFGDTVFAVSAQAELVNGDGEAARRACETAWRHTSPLREVYGRCANPMPVAALACGDTATARAWADAAVASVPGYFQVAALLSRALIDVSDDRPDHAVDDLCAALAVASSYNAYLRLPDVLECLARLVADTGEAAVATRLLGAAAQMRDQMHQGRIGLVDAEYRAGVDTTRKALSEQDFDALWAEGAALSVDESIAYALRGRGRRRRPSSGWASLTPTEIDVVRLVVEGLGNKDIAARLFISHRTVQTHLTHVYTKLGCASRVQLAREAAQRLSDPHSGSVNEASG